MTYRCGGFVVAIDGPAGSGKSTVAKIVAQRLGYLYVDTGAMYRALTLKALRLGMNLHDGEGLAALAHSTDIAFVSEPEGGVRVLLDGEDVSEAVRTPEVSEWVSVVSAFPGVREALTAKQKSLAMKGGVVMDGRDIQTVVAPDAEVKIFLTATQKERARRRWLELQGRGFEVRYEDILRDIRERDRWDSTRAVAPLQKAPDAVEIDTTNMTPEEVAEQIVAMAKSVAKVSRL